MGWRSGQTYSEDLRARVLAAVDRGGRVAAMMEAIAERAKEPTATWH